MERSVGEILGRLERELADTYSEGREAIARGLAQAASLWRSQDGDAAEFEEMVRTHFAGEPEAREALFSRMEFVLESLDGHMLEISRDLRRQSDLDLGTIFSFDEILAGYDPAAHVADDFFANRLAFAVLLNFPVTTLEERLREGPHWTRRQWAETRLAERFSRRIPAEVHLAIGKASAEAEQYIASYNIWMHHALDSGQARLFPPKVRLLSHWNLRDQIKADYAQEAAGGLARQRLIAKILERIVTQTIPAAVVDNPRLDWDPASNKVTAASCRDCDPSAPPARDAASGREPDTRYARLLATFHAARLADPYSPTAPTMISRRFEENRQIPEERVRRMLEDVLGSPLAARVADLVARRLGRKLEPFDIWYSGFRPKTGLSEPELDRRVRERYPTPAAYERDIPRLLGELGFSTATARRLAAHIVVDPARGSGHAMGAARREDKAHLRTRVGREGMDFKGFSIAVHEMGHNVEQVFSLNDIDSTLLQGVPNTAFTEALAFVFQKRDLELLGLARPGARERSWKTLHDFWSTFEIAGAALVDMGVWHWMYGHPAASPEALREATLAIARETWNRFYAPVFATRDVLLLAVYSHMISSFLYLPDYPLGHLIAFQIERQMERAGAVGPEFERMAVIGNVTPDLWMREATGAPVGPEALLEETEKALAEVERS
ncbi:MAG TPA: hypothetical protein VKE50_12285 [Thermoanaerobaculia bacterium]|nr:hypothetical protein [Thermoanaerobaculia bacterium]